MQQDLGAFFGLLGQLQLAAFTQITKDAEVLPEFADRVALSRIAVQEFADFETVAGLLAEQDADLEKLMVPYRDWLDQVVRGLRPADWAEQVLIAYLGFGVANDFMYLIHRGVLSQLQDLVIDVLGDNGHADAVVQVLQPVVSADQRAADRLALWGRRLVGDVLHAIDSLVAADEHLNAVVTRVLSGGDDKNGGKLFTELTAAHSRRMQRLQLTP